MGILDADKKVLVTGAAGFIGYYLSRRLLDMGCTVVGLDNLNDYYDVNLKYARLDLLKPYSKLSFFKIDLANKSDIDSLSKMKSLILWSTLPHRQEFDIQ